MVSLPQLSCNFLAPSNVLCTVRSHDARAGSAASRRVAHVLPYSLDLIGITALCRTSAETGVVQVQLENRRWQNHRKN